MKCSALVLLIVPVIASRFRGPSDLPATVRAKPLLSCEGIDGTSEWDVKLHEAMTNMCRDKGNWPLMEVFLDQRFEEQYKHFYAADGWVDAAWVNYVGVKTDSGDYFGKLTEYMVESVHRFSQKPIVVINFGSKYATELDPKRFPRLVLLHARTANGVSFNFNKLRAVLLARVKTGVSLDSDMVMVGPQGDSLLNRTAEEITEKYPFPMMPTHFLDRDPRDQKAHIGNFLEYNCNNCPTPTMRWGQAQPSWTYWSMPFISRWLSAKMAGRAEQDVPTRNIQEDEDLLNVALWKEGATKAWCAWQMGGVSFLWENLYAEHAPGPYPYYNDPRYFPNGVPVAFYFAHAEKSLEKVEKALKYMADPARVNLRPKHIYHHNKFYTTFAEVMQQDDNKDLKCLM